MKLYRMMSKKEFDTLSSTSPFSWKGKCKWFTDNKDFILSRVTDGKFNNSKFKKDRYTHLVEYIVEDDKGFTRVSTNEVLLQVKDEPKVKVLCVNKIGELI